MYLADMEMARVSVGMMAFFSVTWEESTFSQPNRTARISISSTATKKFGMELPMKLKKRST